MHWAIALFTISILAAWTAPAPGSKTHSDPISTAALQDLRCAEEAGEDVIQADME